MNYLSAGILRQAIKVRQEAFIDRSIFLLSEHFYYVSIVKSSRRSRIFIPRPVNLITIPFSDRITKDFLHLSIIWNVI